MTTIYIDPSALALPEAAERLDQLIDAGHDMVVIGQPDAEPTAPARAARTQQMPQDVPPGAWFMTADPATCGDRRADLRTLLVGPRPDERRPTRCDSVARDMREAILDILAADAMA